MVPSEQFPNLSTPAKNAHVRPFSPDRQYLDRVDTQLLARMQVQVRLNENQELAVISASAPASPLSVSKCKCQESTLTCIDMLKVNMNA